jgi:hypothetical protein
MKTPTQLFQKVVAGRASLLYENNTSDNELTFPREMCVGTGFYFPATTDIPGVDGVWATGN